MGGVTEWMLVPREPTEAMRDAVKSIVSTYAAGRAWGEMLKAAPTPPAEAQVVGGEEVAEVLREMTRTLAFSRKYAEALEAAIAALSAQPRPEDGEVVITRAEDGEIVMVSRQDEDGKILSVIASTCHAGGKPQPASAPVGVASSAKSLRDAANEIIRGGRVSRRAGYAEYLVMILTFAADHLEALAQQPAAVCAKPLTWQEEKLSRSSGWREWADRLMGFHISFDPEDEPGNRYTASWGEGEPEDFATLEEAKAWCQEHADTWIRECASARTQQPAAVDEAIYRKAEVREAMEVLRGRNGSTALHADVLDEMERVLTAALAQPQGEK